MALVQKIVDRLKTVNGRNNHVAAVINYRKKEEKGYLLLPIKESSTMAIAQRYRAKQASDVNDPSNRIPKIGGRIPTTFPDDVMACFQEGKLDSFTEQTSKCSR